MGETDSAISVDGLVRGYGKVRVLEGLDMSVQIGSIYGLLGPSGCGKTTLLKVILGRLVPESGSTTVLGGTPGEKGSVIPGSAVGYSPQEIALYLDLSIAETLSFHGRLHGMSRDEVLKRQEWLLTFLDLPDSSHQVGKLSGGQKRRVSLAVALLHEPKLLLLDEPTVGVDPELRARLWGHLQEISEGGTTVVITTHYIDEAGQADCVGLMRNGALLTEDTPEAVMVSQDASSLEEAFLSLCKRDSRGDTE
ncbi:MAG: ABC transporter ATP-binding protein [Candidatus Thalassarchaeaceae archaeon]|jgi:ABC-type multidrug transport system ATPase subunit|nr:ABC transporter ATP-binding protein [Candidatus Thalassarchaeaceae archaeon]